MACYTVSQTGCHWHSASTLAGYLEVFRKSDMSETVHCNITSIYLDFVEQTIRTNSIRRFSVVFTVYCHKLASSNGCYASSCNCKVLIRYSVVREIYLLQRSSRHSPVTIIFLDLVFNASLRIFFTHRASNVAENSSEFRSRTASIPYVEGVSMNAPCILFWRAKADTVRVSSHSHQPIST